MAAIQSATLNAATLHTVAMVLSGGAIAWVVYRFVGLRLLRRAWLNLDLLWSVLLVVFCALVFVKGLGLPVRLLGPWFGV